MKGGRCLRYKYVAYKYTRRSRGDTTFHSAWETFGAWSQPSTITWRPPTDVYETPDRLIVVIELAGISEEDMAVTLFSDLLVVEGRRQQAAFTEMNACHQLGIKYGDFRAEVYVPFAVDDEKVKAEYKNGLLIVTLNKKAPDTGIST
jgi:HSP20 family protein